ncbi:hypothetical protein BDP27DRAFT_556161 [Rhodocollybia butyracea]|uniref:Uncharacterized protein n=1 Tax=Rhodocollybia butyracea TaxID=206335 RepID=A0A9P5TWV0_9AGAR|nr:hypothetical protein BDP27DRAFT_556161 [Rhodocollybia butyracea]
MLFFKTSPFELLSNPPLSYLCPHAHLDPSTFIITNNKLDTSTLLKALNCSMWSLFKF